MQVRHVIINEKDLPEFKTLDPKIFPELQCEKTYIENDVITFEYRYIGLTEVK